MATRSCVYSPPTRLIPQLPDEISIQCIARVPRLLYPTLALVSQTWRTLVNSPLLFTLRSDLGLSQHGLCIINTDHNWNLFLLLDPQNPIPSVLRLPSPPFPTDLSACAANAHKLFVLGGFLDRKSSREIQIFDSRLNSWSVGPPMRSPRWCSTAVGFINGKLYALGGCRDSNSDSWAEVLDMQLGVWTTLPTPAHLRGKITYPRSALIEGKLLALLFMGEAGVVFDPEAEQPWSDMPTVIREGWKWGLVAVVDEVMYSVDSLGRISGYDLPAGKWKRLEVCDDDELPKSNVIALLNVGGILVGVWKVPVDEEVDISDEEDIFLAGIKVSRKSCGGLCGSIVWKRSDLRALLKGSSITNYVALEF